jgi:hypothetical protein
MARPDPNKNRRRAEDREIRLRDAGRWVEDCYDRRYADAASGSISMPDFYWGWASTILGLAGTIAADGWWKEVKKVLPQDDQGRRVLATLRAAQAGDWGKTAALVEDAFRRGDEMAEAVRWLRGGLYRRLLGGGSGPAADGPAAPVLFRWKGKSCDLPPLPWRLLNYLWTRGAANVQEVEDAVWGGPASQNAIRSALYKANTALAEAGLPVSLSQKSGQITLSRPD